MPIIKFIIKVIAGFFIVLVAIALLIAASVPSEEQVDQAVDDIYVKVAEDAEEQYKMALAHGTKADACVRAGLVAEAYLQAKNEGQYKTWKGVEKLECDKAGVPR